jgi:hypothetical protein
MTNYYLFLLVILIVNGRISQTTWAKAPLHRLQHLPLHLLPARSLPELPLPRLQLRRRLRQEGLVHARGYPLGLRQ